MVNLNTFIKKRTSLIKNKRLIFVLTVALLIVGISLSFKIYSCIYEIPLINDFQINEMYRC